jgi:redox-sensitive bicupin YhaK (pirin superfamily)
MIDFVIDRRWRDLGGFHVGRVLPFAQRRMVGPFIFFDHIGPTTFAQGVSRDVDVRPHPHIGLSTLTYLFDGEIMHRDSVGSEQAIRPGEVNWMVAGGGVTHSERFEKARAEGGPMHGIQSWIALPEAFEETAPAFTHHEVDALPTFEEDGAWTRLIAGEAYGAKAPVEVHSPLFYAHCELEEGAIAPLPSSHAERAAYIVSGNLEADGRVYETGQMLVFAKGGANARAAAPAKLLLLGGEPLGERFIEWNFVSSRKERIDQAKADWRAGRMKLPDLDNSEFIPLPPDPPPSAPAMS